MMGEYIPSGHDRLWNWFGCTRASWLTMPRVMMHAMPDDWQARMAVLCDEWDKAWDSQNMPSPQVSAVDRKGKFTRWPCWLLNYRHPDNSQIELIRKPEELP